jgi:hypothetical protein
MSEPEKITVCVEISTSRQWGSEQQNSLDRVLLWHGTLDTAQVLKVWTTLHDALSGLACGDFQPISKSAAEALYEFGKEQQLPLIEKS